MLDRDDIEGPGSVRGNSSQENEIKNMPINRDNSDFREKHRDFDRGDEPEALARDNQVAKRGELTNWECNKH